MITRFYEVGLTGRKRFVCACGRKLTRQKRFYQTINPYNRNSSGQMKTQGEIFEEVKTELDAWVGVADPCTHVIRPKCSVANAFRGDPEACGDCPPCTGVR